MNTYIPTIGLEIHAELKTQTKMFCDSKNDPFIADANVHVCPVCLAHPGTLPVINREAVKHVLKVGLAVEGTLADYTEFDRKNYFYPDLPKGYQLSQYEYPLVSGGELHGVKLTRIHLEEDTASSMHDESSGATTIDYNRAGVPLMELVTEPVVHSAEEAGSFARELQLLLRYLGASNANMERGEMRVEANISVSRDGDLGTKVEVKNLNSFNIMERAVAYEIKRQIELLERGEKVIQETRGWDDGKQATFPQRVKEGSADYRYFPDPDLPSLKLSELSELSAPVLTAEMPELPNKRRERYEALGIKKEDADLLVREPRLADFLDEVAKELGIGNKKAIGLAVNYTLNDLLKITRDTEGRDSNFQSEMLISAQNFAKIICLVDDEKISSRVAKDLLGASIASGRDPERIANEGNLLKVDSSDALSGIIQAIIVANPKVVDDYRSGKEAALQYLVGQGMKQTKGAADPVVLRTLIKEALRNTSA